MTKKITKHQTLSNALWSYFELLKAEIVDKIGIETDTIREDSEHLKNLQRISELLGIKGLKSACIAVLSPQSHKICDKCGILPE